MRNLTEEILALDTDEVNLIDRADVLEIIKDAVVVEVDTGMYPENPKHSETDRRILAIISTAYNLMADFAAEMAAKKAQAQLAKAGKLKPGVTDAAIFSANKESGDGATSYRDLAPHSIDAVLALGGALDTLMAVANEQTQFALVISRAIGDGVPDFTGLASSFGIDLKRDFQ